MLYIMFVLHSPMNFAKNRGTGIVTKRPLQGATRLHGATQTTARCTVSAFPHPWACWPLLEVPAATFGLSFFRFVFGGDTQEHTNITWGLFIKGFFGGETNSPVLHHFTPSCQKNSTWACHSSQLEALWVELLPVQ